MGHGLYLRCSRHLCTWRCSRAAGISESQFLAQSPECAPRFHVAASSWPRPRRCCPEVGRIGTSPHCQNFPLREDQRYVEHHIDFFFWVKKKKKRYGQLSIWSRSTQFWMVLSECVPCPAAVRIWGVSLRTEPAPDYQTLLMTSPWRLSCLAECRCLQSIHSLGKTGHKTGHVTDQNICREENHMKMLSRP